ncbi:MAG: hypothetical protein AAFY47_09975, partial [Pseudomonadota bacterium]
NFRVIETMPIWAAIPIAVVVHDFAYYWDRMKRPKQADAMGKPVIPIIGKVMNHHRNRNRRPDRHGFNDAKIIENQRVKRQRHKVHNPQVQDDGNKEEANRTQRVRIAVIGTAPQRPKTLKNDNAKKEPEKNKRSAGSADKADCCLDALHNPLLRSLLIQE